MPWRHPPLRFYMLGWLLAGCMALVGAGMDYVIHERVWPFLFIAGFAFTGTLVMWAILQVRRHGDARRAR